MTVLFMGPSDSRVLGFLREQPEAVITTNEPFGMDQIDIWRPDFAVSHSYRTIVKPPVLNRFGSRIINLHISFLPWNRGADPNLWSFLEDTPAGVTIHVMDSGLDTGSILVQQKLFFDDGETLRSTYEALQVAMFSTFKTHWAKLRDGAISPRPQPVGGSKHYVRDKAPYVELLSGKGWDTPVGVLRGQALRGKL
jgi:methionyl-tRNA formyltransferase